MFTIHKLFCCAVIGLACMPGTIMSAEDDPFGLIDNPAASQAAPADPAHTHPHTHTEAALDAEKSVLVAGAKEAIANDEKDLCRCIGETNSVAIARIEKALESPLRSNGLDFTQTPLEEVVNLLQDDYGIPIQIDRPALESIGIEVDQPVTVNLHNISLRSALRLLLKPHQLTYIIHDEVLMITTPEEAESQLLTCVYDVRNLVEKPKMPMGAVSWADFDPLVDTITSCVSRETWKENGGGEAEIRPLQPGLLVISQTQAVKA